VRSAPASRRAPIAAGTATVLHVGAAQTLDSVMREQLLGLRERGWTCVLACQADGWERRLAGDGFAIRPIRMGRRPGIGQVVGGGADLARILRRERFAIVHTHNAHHGLVGRVAAAAHRTPSVHTWRYNPLDATDRAPVRLAYGVAEGVASRLGDAVLFQNAEDLEHALGRRLVPPGRAVLVGNGIRIERFERPGRPRDRVRADLGLPDEAEVVLCIGRLEERKGQSSVIRAVAELALRRPAVRLLLVGTGPDAPALEAQAARLGLGARVGFLGQRDDVVDLLHASDVLCLASRREGVPRAVMEAMAARLPVVATDVVGTRAVVRDGETGLLAPFGDPAGLAARMARVLDDRALAGRLAARAHESLRADWHEDQVVDRVDRAYRLLLATGVP
jgi:glycosyltransferase involved in cell wall biosynthesis